jgi:glycosyltransferase involved in cell wall biosynthesis
MQSNFALLKYLRKHDIDIGVVVPERGSYNTVLDEQGFVNYVGDYAWWSDDNFATDSGWLDSSAVSRAESIVKDFSPDVILTNTLLIPWGAIAAARSNIPHIWIGREFPDNEFSFLRQRFDFIKTYANVIMANSSEVAKTYRERFAAATKVFYSYTSGDGIQLNSDIETTRIVSVADVHSRKNQLELLEAYVALRKDSPSLDLRVLLIGEENPEYVAKLREFIDRVGMRDCVNLAGFLENPYSLVGPNDIVVQTSVSESIGRSTIEAIKLGLPLILSDIPGFREASRLCEGAGIFYTLHDVNDLAHKIADLLDRRESVKAQSRKYQEVALRTFNEEKCTSPVVAAIREVRGQDNPAVGSFHSFFSPLDLSRMMAG